MSGRRAAVGSVGMVGGGVGLGELGDGQRGGALAMKRCQISAGQLPPVTRIGVRGGTMAICSSPGSPPTPR